MISKYFNNFYSNKFLIFLLVLSSIVVSSAFFTLSYLNIPFGTMMPFSLVPLFYATRKIALQNRNQNIFSIFKRSSICFWFFGFILQLISFFWITKPIEYFGAVPFYYCYPLFILICILSSLFFPILFSPFTFSLCFKNNYKDKIFSILSLAFIMTLFEIYIPRFFNWSFGGLLSSNIIFSQLQSLFGFNTGSLFIFYVSLLLSTMSKLNFKKHVLILSLVFVGVIGFGSIRIYYLNNILIHSEKFRVGFVQPNFTFSFLANRVLPSHNSQQFSLNTMLHMSKQVIDKSIIYTGKKLDLLVWPESTAPNFFIYSQKDIDEVKNFSKQNDIPLLIQSEQIKKDDFQKSNVNNYNFWSSSFIVNSHGVLPFFFQKWIPMPFGEEFPFENKFPFIGSLYRKVFKNASKVERGVNYNALPIPRLNAQSINVTPLICFDTINQELSYLSATKGQSHFFVNQANFVWMVDSNAGLELSLLNQMRAIENGRSIVVASNTGPSLAFDALGRLILPPTPLLSQEFNFIDIPLYRGKTLFQIVYHWPLDIMGVCSIFYCIYSRRKNYAAFD